MKTNLRKEEENMKTTKGRVVALTFVAFLFIAGLWVAISRDVSAAQMYSFASASSGGAWYAQAVGLADLWTREIKGIKVIAEETGGGVENARLLGGKKVDIAFINSDVAVPALRGEEPFKEPILSAMNAAVIFKLKGNPIYLLSSVKSGIKTFNDIKGKRVSIGPAGSAVNVAVKIIAKGHGMSLHDFSPTYLGWTEAADALSDGMIDVGILVGAPPAPAVQGLASRLAIQFIRLDPKCYGDLRRNGFAISSLPPNTYKGQAQSIELATFVPYIWVRKELGDDLVYKMVKLVMENRPKLANVHKALGAILVPSEKEVEEFGAKIHPGALKYLAQHGK
jgi:TRAP transporter TAXI family solute receptor